MSELEEMVVEQDNALAVAAEKYKKSRSEITRMKKENEEQVNKLKQEIARSLSVFRVTFFFGGGGGEGESKLRLHFQYSVWLSNKFFPCSFYIVGRRRRNVKNILLILVIFDWNW